MIARANHAERALTRHEVLIALQQGPTSAEALADRLRFFGDPRRVAQRCAELLKDGLIERVAEQPARKGPARTVYGLSASGRDHAAKGALP